jgi:hypothetical protein
MKSVIVDVERLAFSPVFSDAELSQVFLFLVARVGQVESCVIRLPIDKMASFLGMGQSTAKSAMDWLISLGLVTAIEPDGFDVNCITVEDADWHIEDMTNAVRSGEALLDGVVVPALEACKGEVANRVSVEVLKQRITGGHQASAKVVVYKGTLSSSITFACDGLDEAFAVTKEVRSMNSEVSKAKARVTFEELNEVIVKEHFVLFLRLVLAAH